jgi:hypothetical protein
MPLTASTALEKENGSNGNGNNKLASRVLAGMEALIFAGVLYLCASVTTTEKTIIKMQAVAESNQVALATIPTLIVRLTEAEKDIQVNSRDIAENKGRIQELERRTTVRPSQAQRDRDKELGYGLQ